MVTSRDVTIALTLATIILQELPLSGARDEVALFQPARVPPKTCQESKDLATRLRIMYALSPYT